jgi:hypothetical protein
MSKNPQINARVVLCKCPSTRNIFGIRIEEKENDWVRTWAFKISESKALHEGYEKTKSSGTLLPTPEYPGCPYCGAMVTAQCSCGKLFCWNNESDTGTAVCPWCGRKDEYSPSETIEFEGGGL